MEGVKEEQSNCVRVEYREGIQLVCLDLNSVLTGNVWLCLLVAVVTGVNGIHSSDKLFSVVLES